MKKDQNLEKDLERFIKQNENRELMKIEPHKILQLMGFKVDAKGLEVHSVDFRIYQAAFTVLGKIFQQGFRKVNESGDAKIEKEAKSVFLKNGLPCSDGKKALVYALTVIRAAAKD